MLDGCAQFVHNAWGTSGCTRWPPLTVGLTLCVTWWILDAIHQGSIRVRIRVTGSDLRWIASSSVFLLKTRQTCLSWAMQPWFQPLSEGMHCFMMILVTYYTTLIGKYQCRIRISHWNFLALALIILLKQAVLLAWYCDPNHWHIPYFLADYPRVICWFWHKM